MPYLLITIHVVVKQQQACAAALQPRFAASRSPPAAGPTAPGSAPWHHRQWAARRTCRSPVAWRTSTNPDLATSVKDLELITTVVASADALTSLARWVARRRNGAGPERDTVVLARPAAGQPPATGGSARSPGLAASTASNTRRGGRGRDGQ